MSFRIAARTILHLGSELISSDGVAFYELIKNSYDARSSNVEIQVLMVLARRAQRDALSSIRESRKLDENEAAQLARLEELKQACLEQLIEGASTASTVREAIRCRTLSVLTSPASDFRRRRRCMRPWTCSFEERSWVPGTVSPTCSLKEAC